jgi:hypothetical protein
MKTLKFYKKVNDKWQLAYKLESELPLHIIKTSPEYHFLNLDKLQLVVN